MPPETSLRLRTIVYFVALLTLAAVIVVHAPEPDGVSDPDLGAPVSERLRIARMLDRVEVVDSRPSVRPPVESRPASTDLVAEVHALLRRGSRADALELLLDTASTRSMPAEAWVLLGHQLDRVGSAEAARAAWTEAAAIDPAHRADLARGLTRQGRHAEAAATWRRIAEDPESVDHAEARGRLAVASHFAGLPVEAGWLDDAPAVLRSIVLDGAPPRASVRAVVDPATAGLVIGEPVRVDSGGGAELAEPSIVHADGVVVAGWNDERHPDGRWRLGAGVSTDGGVTWSEGLLRAPGSIDSTQDGDPMTAVDPRTGTLWLGGIEFAGPASRVYVARRSGNGFEAPVVVASGSSFDKCWMAAGPAPGLPASTRLYVTFSLPSSLHVSSDLGASWSARRALDDDGLGFLPRVAPGGVLHVGYFDFAGFVEGPRILLQTSVDGGTTVGSPKLVAERLDVWGLQDGSRFPGRFRAPIIPVWAVSPVDGTLYLVYADTTAVVSGDANVDLYFSRSSDGGATWTTPTVIHGDATPPGDQFFPWLEVDATGRIHLVFFDSRHTPQVDDVEDARLDVAYAWSEDGGTSWSEIRLTPSSFGTAGVDWPILGQFAGDYLGLAVVDDGVVLVAYPKTSGADLDLFVQRIEHAAIFTDGFESGTTAAWSNG